MFVLKKIKDNFILLGKEKPKDGDLVYNSEKDEICNFVDLSHAGVGQGAFLKIIGAKYPPKVKHYPGVESNGGPIAILRGYGLLFGEEEIRYKASEWALNNADETMATNSALNKGYIAGYKACQDESFTLEDMKTCFEMSRDKIKHPDWDYTFDDFDQFIKKFKDAKTTWLVEVELETKTIPMETTLGVSDFFVPKITDGYINITKIAAVKHPLYV